MKKLLYRHFYAIPVIALMLAFTGCETSEGVGRDMQNLGDEIEDAAN